MKKIPNIFKRNPENMREILNEPNDKCLWVFAGEGVATRKYDGTCVKIEDGKYYKRREVKPGKKIPAGFVLEELDPNTGKSFGWIEVDPNEKDNRWHVEAFENELQNGTYELVGPKIQGNPEKYYKHTLLRHSEADQYFDIPRTFDGIKEWFKEKDIEGIVFHHPDGRMGKIRKADFKLKR